MKKDDQKKKKVFFIKETVNEENELGQQELVTKSHELVFDENAEPVLMLDDKAILKRQQKAAKAQAKVAKAAAKEEQKQSKKSRFFNFHKKSDEATLNKKTAKKALFNKKALKAKKEKTPHNYQQAFKEFPVKMVKEVSKIRWSTKENLLIKFIQVILFIAVFALLFYAVDLGFEELFSLMRVI